MVIFYGDESGSHGRGDYILSGYVAHRDTWKFFDGLWNAKLAEANPRPIEYFKMSEWQHREKQFENWCDDDAVMKLGKMYSVLAAVLETGAVGEFTCSTNWEIYNRCVNGRCKDIFSDPYYFNLRQVTLRRPNSRILGDTKAKSITSSIQGTAPNTTHLATLHM